jgi:pyruvate ferredoxin oxidoreductase gamma subunit
MFIVWYVVELLNIMMKMLEPRARDVVKSVEIIWHGRGGQGVVTANEVLAGAALKEGKFIKAFPEFGPERMGAPIRAFTRLSDGPIQVHSQVTQPDIVMVLDPTLLKQIDVVGGLKDGGVLIANYAEGRASLAGLLHKKVDCHAVNATKIALEEIGRPTANTAMLGALVKMCQPVSLRSVTDEISARFAGKFKPDVIAKNVRAVERAFEEVD